ncbi:hypothetical protein DFO74_10361 [Chromohalobacter israelensis]|nr:hypothetical protein DFO74_10361 [Chromohalobacter salexigens]
MGQGVAAEVLGVLQPVMIAQTTLERAINGNQRCAANGESG